MVGKKSQSRFALIAFLFGLAILIPVSFAGWETTAVLALTTSTVLLGLLYMIGFGFGIQELQIMAKEELFQIIATGLLIVAILGSNNLVNSISTIPAFVSTPAGGPAITNLQASASLIINQSITEVGNVHSTLSAFDASAAAQASRGFTCNVGGVGYSVTGCGGYSMLNVPLSMAGGISGFALGELAVMRKLIDVAHSFALPLLLPFGIILRSFKLTRGGGGLLIAVAISLHILVPMSVVFSNLLATTFIASPFSEEYRGDPSATIGQCSPERTGESNEENVITAYNMLRADMRRYMTIMLIKATLGPILALLVMATSIRTLSSLMGSEIDISPLAKFV